jgi:transposase-like protein
MAVMALLDEPSLGLAPKSSKSFTIIGQIGAEGAGALIERALGAELSDHLGYERGDPAGRGSGNSHNGTSAKTILTEDGEIDIAVPIGLAASSRY